MLFIVNKNYDGDIGFMYQTINLIVMWLILVEILEISEWRLFFSWSSCAYEDRLGNVLVMYEKRNKTKLTKKLFSCISE